LHNAKVHIVKAWKLIAHNRLRNLKVACVENKCLLRMIFGAHVYLISVSNVNDWWKGIVKSGGGFAWDIFTYNLFCFAVSSICICVMLKVYENHVSIFDVLVFMWFFECVNSCVVGELNVEMNCIYPQIYLLLIRG